MSKETELPSSAAAAPQPFGRVRTVFLDRDGVLNEKMPEGKYVTRWEEFRLLPGVVEAIARLNRAGLKVMLVSNQRGVALGLYSTADVDRIHGGMLSVLESQGARLDGIFYCPHDKGQCDCRKPLPGLFEQALTSFPEVDATTSVMIGDSLSDMEFGRRLGMMCIFIEGDPTRRKSGAEKAQRMAGFSCASLPEAVDHLLDEDASGSGAARGTAPGYPR
ncbi:MAG TPA: HAD family hydrolase [Terracidiphilus sp.]